MLRVAFFTRTAVCCQQLVSRDPFYDPGLDACWLEARFDVEVEVEVLRKADFWRSRGRFVCHLDFMSIGKGGSEMAQ